MTQPNPTDQGGTLRIFISYRRDDAPDAAGRLYDHLVERFGTNVFMDVDTIEPGLDFVEVLNKAVASCDVLVALIGKGWLTSTDAAGRRRLDNPEDFVRLEIEAALKRDVRVIPVLLHGVAMPGSNELPDSLTGLARRNALQIDYARWRDDVRRLLQTLDRLERGKVGRVKPEGQATRAQPRAPLQAEKDESEQRAREPAEKEALERAPGKPSRRWVWIALAVLDAITVLALAVIAAVSANVAFSVIVVLGPAGLGWAFARSSNSRVQTALGAIVAIFALTFAVWAANEEDANAAAEAVLVVGGLALLGWGLWQAVRRSRQS